MAAAAYMHGHVEPSVFPPAKTDGAAHTCLFNTNFFLKSIGSRITDYCVNKHDFDSQPDRCCGGNSGTLSVEMDVHASGIGRHNLTEPVTWYYKFLGSRNSRTIMLISTIWIRIKVQDTAEVTLVLCQ